jgi:hypothetical protein
MTDDGSSRRDFVRAGDGRGDGARPDGSGESGKFLHHVSARPDDLRRFVVFAVADSGHGGVSGERIAVGVQFPDGYLAVYDSDGVGPFVTDWTTDELVDTYADIEDAADVWVEWEDDDPTGGADR